MDIESTTSNTTTTMAASNTTFGPITESNTTLEPITEFDTTSDMAVVTTVMTTIRNASSRYLSSTPYDFTSDIPKNTTEDPGSDLSSFEEFCGNSPFWDTRLLLDSSYPKFTACFQQVAVVWIPCLLYIAVSVPFVLYLSTRPSVPQIKTGIVNVAKTICTICLLGVTVATIIVRATDDDQDDIPDALYVSEGLKCGSFLLHLLVSHVERRKGVVSSVVSWTFWLILFIVNIIPFYSNIKEDKDETDEFGFIIFYFYDALVLAALIIASFVEPRDEGYYKDLSRAADFGKPSPEYEVSIPNRISFWWMTSLVILGFKKSLAENEVYDLNDDDKCERLMSMHLETWEKEKAKVGKYNSMIRLPKKSISIEDDLSGSPTKRIGEKTPLLEGTSKTGDKKEAEKKEKSPFKAVSVLKVLLHDHGFMLCSALTAKAACDVFNILTPKITEALLDYITYKDKYFEWRGYALATCYLGVNSIVAVGSNQAIFYTKRAALRMKGTLINAIFRKSLTAVIIDDETSKGEVANLMAVDCQKIEDIANFIFLIFSAPAQIALSLYLLYDQLGVAVFAGMGVLFVTIPVNALIGSFYQRWQKLQMKYKDERIKLLTEVLGGIKVLKLYAWEKSFQEKIEAIRLKEVHIIRSINYLIAFLMYFFMALPNLVQVTSFAVHISEKDYLNPSVAFVSLQLFNMLTPPLTLLPLLIPIMIQTIVSINRISSYLNKDDIKTDSVRKNSNAVNAVEIKNGNFTWTVEQPIPTLRNIEMEVEPGSLVAVVGTVGCGKSSLISAILGEMESLSGIVTINGSIAYVPQEAWIQNATLRNNVTFGKDYREKTYNRIIEACALTADLTILPGGDQTEIGEKGINISGGQKQRVSLARAVYSDRDIFLMDDPLSAVDSHVGKHIFKEVIGENGVLRKKTRILVTHGVQWLPMVDKIFVVKHGEIRESGNYTELMEKNGDFAHFIKEYAQDNNDSSSEDKSDEFDDLVETDQYKSADEAQPYVTDSALSDTSMELARSPSLRRRRKSAGAIKPHKPPSVRRQSSVRRKSSLWGTSNSMLTASGKVLGLEDSTFAVKHGTTLIETESNESGKVKSEIYLYYLKQIGLKMCIIAIILYLIYAGCSVFAAIWLTEWTGDTYLLNISHKDTNKDKFDDKTNKYLGIYAAASVGQGIFVLIFSFLAAMKMADAAVVLHKNMLSNVLRSPMSFFDTTPLGRLMNRFSRDVDVLDNLLPMGIRQSMNVFGLVVITIVNISYATPIFLVALVPLAVIYISVMVVYVPTCRQLRRINSTTRSPIYSHFNETLSGTASIRAYGCQERFIQESMHRVDNNLKFYFTSSAAASWLSFRLQLLGNMVIFAAALFAVTASDIDTSVVGLSVAYATSMTQALEQLVNSISECETNIVSVERLKEYTISPQEAAWSLSHQPSSDWPDKGNIVFDAYETRYRAGLDLVLKDMNCSIKGGEKIGIVGRTGAGKSSMTVALFRIIEPAGGKIVIDGEDVSRLGLHDLRNKITILPQEPVIFTGSLRMNLDPFDKYTEPELWNALEHSYLKEFVESLPAGLEYECGEEGSNLSVGQRQLVCLARTLLRKTKILVLDEATAAVDMETDDLIQKTIRTEFKDCTILTIAHRLNTILDYDRVMVLDKGLIKEFDAPSVLLADENSIFHGMAKDAGIV